MIKRIANLKNNKNKKNKNKKQETKNVCLFVIWFDWLVFDKLSIETRKSYDIQTQYEISNSIIENEKKKNLNF